MKTTITKKEIMTKAWTVARFAQRTHGGLVGEFFGASLRLVWAEIKDRGITVVTTKKTVQSIEDRLVAAGGKKWEKGEMSRIYFNFGAADFDLDCEYYNTGNVSGAEYEGTRISNSQARRYLGDIRCGKAWYDCKTEQFRVRFGYEDFADKALDAMKKFANV